VRGGEMRRRGDAVGREKETGGNRGILLT